MDRTLHDGDPVEVGMSPERIERVLGLCAAWAEQGLTPSLQVLVARRGVVVLHEAWGRLGPEADDPPLGTDSIFAVGSLTKPLTATAIMCLVEDGLLGLNRPVQEYVPEFVGEGKELVMVHHLLTHTAGLNNEALDAYAAAAIRAGRIPVPPPVPGMGPEEFLHLRVFDHLHDAPLWKPPAVEMSYSNYGYRLLHDIVARVAGEPTDAFVQRRILDPLGMTGSSYLGLPPERRHRQVRRAPDQPLLVLDYPDLMAEIAPGPGALYSTARDLAVFAQMFLNGGVYGGQRILSPATVREMTRNQIPGISAHWAGEHFPEASWGLGWSVEENKRGVRDPSLLSATAFNHGGVSMNLVWADPAYDLVGVYQSVLPKRTSRWRRGDWCADLFVNAVTAAIVE